tara:strand:- start:326 stop:1072 length:747 start_codon:yes stop_codon:yes gene_type:complete
MNISERGLIERVKEEFNRPIPEEYRHLIWVATHPDQDPTSDRWGEIFYSVGDPLAGITLEDISKWPEKLEEYRDLIKGKDFFDLGCGSAEFPDGFHSKYNSVADFAQNMGAQRYIGVDIHHPGEYKGFSDVQGNFTRVYLGETEMLQFLASIPDSHSTKKVLWFSGIESKVEPCYLENNEQELESDNPDIRCFAELWKDIANYYTAIYHELDRVTEKGDIIFNGKRTHIGQRLSEFGFEDNHPFYIKK